MLLTKIVLPEPNGRKFASPLAKLFEVNPISNQDQMAIDQELSVGSSAILEPIYHPCSLQTFRNTYIRLLWPFPVVSPEFIASAFTKPIVAPPVVLSNVAAAIAIDDDMLFDIPVNEPTLDQPLHQPMEPLGLVDDNEGLQSLKAKFESLASFNSSQSSQPMPQGNITITAQDLTPLIECSDVRYPIHSSCQGFTPAPLDRQCMQFCRP